MNETWIVERYEQNPKGYSLPDRFRILEDDDRCVCGDVRHEDDADMISAVPDMLNALMVIALNAHTSGLLNADPQSFEQVKQALIKAGWSKKLDAALNHSS